MLHLRPVAKANASLKARMNRLEPPVPPIAVPASSRLRIALIGLAVLLYLALAATAASSGDDVLSVVCVMILVSVVLAPRLRARGALAWLAWFAIAAALGLLAALEHGAVALDLVPAVINLALAALFGTTLARGQTPLIARVIEAIEGRERLALPRVADYARGLTQAWTLLFVVQAVLLLGIVAARHGVLGNGAPAWAIGYLHFGGYLLPAVFMLGEFAFRRRYLHHIPHDSLGGFMQRLVRNWPRLLREHIDPADAVR